MKAIIFAAGMGKRISEDIGNIPKSLLKINGKTLIRRSVEFLLEKNIEVSICLGYKHELIEEELKDYNVKFFYNPFYSMSNNIISLWLSKSFMNDDTIILTADLYYSKEIIERIINSKKNIALVVDSSRVLTGDYFIEINEENRLVSYGKNLDITKRNFENVGFAFIGYSVMNTFIKMLDELICNGNINDYYEQIFFDLETKRILDLDYIDIKGLKWNEIDNYDDYLNLRENIYE